MAQVRGIYMMDWIAGHFNNMVDMLSGPEGVNGFIRVLEFIGTFAGAISGVRRWNGTWPVSRGIITPRS